MKYRVAVFLTGSSLVLSIAPPAGTGYAEPATNVTSYTVQGVLLELRSQGRIAVVAHENIPGYMEPMTMPFNVKKPADLKELQPGDKIRFRLSVTKSDDWIDEIKKVGSGGVRKSVKVETLPELQTGAPIPDCLLTNQSGRTLRLSDFKGQAVALTFFFGRCPLPTLCPRMNNHFAAVQQVLHSDARTNWQLLSLSFDPGFDTPEFLASLAEAHKSDPRHWSFATSSQEEIRKLAGAFGFKFWRENGTFSHNLRTVVVDSSGRFQHVFSGNEWRPADLVVEMNKAMGAQQ